jgi:hypothetical protein
VLNLHVAETREKAMVKGRPARTSSTSSSPRTAGSRATATRTGRRCRSTTARRSRSRTSRRSRSSARSTTPVDAIGFWRDLLDLKHICFFFDYPGLTREEMNEQMHLVADEVFPRLGEPIERRPVTGRSTHVTRR